MTYEEALKTIDVAIAEIEWQCIGKHHYPMEFIASLDKAKEALEKQISKRPAESYYKGIYWCPGCHSAIKKRIDNAVRDIENCPFCGKHLDWSEK